MTYPITQGKCQNIFFMSKERVC